MFKEIYLQQPVMTVSGIKRVENKFDERFWLGKY